jgi:S1-C subfamily serine protease
VDPGSLAEQMGLKVGDYLLEVNGNQLADKNALKQLISTGAIQYVEIWRAGKLINLNEVDKL